MTGREDGYGDGQGQDYPDTKNPDPPPGEPTVRRERLLCGFGDKIETYRNEYESSQTESNECQIRTVAVAAKQRHPTEDQQGGANGEHRYPHPPGEADPSHRFHQPAQAQVAECSANKRKPVDGVEPYVRGKEC